QGEFVRVRQELASIRQQFYERYRQRRDRLSGLHEAVRRAARKLQERKRDFEGQYESVTAIQEQEAARQAAYAAACEELDRDRQRLAEQQRLLEAQRQEGEEKFEA